MKEQGESKPLIKEENEDNSAQSQCVKNGYYLLGNSLAFGGVVTFAASVANLQMIQVISPIVIFPC